MLRIVVPPRDLWDEEKEQFLQCKGATLMLEHSLVSVSKWEAKWKKPFLGDTPKTRDETIDYIRCMNMTQNVDESVYGSLSAAEIQRINSYVSDKQTATWFSEHGDAKNRKGGKKKVITSEVIYGWMISLGIPMECQKWHLSRLLTLIRVCDIQNSKGNKMDKKQAAMQRSALNAKRRRARNSRG